MTRLLLKDIILPCQEVLLDMHMRGILVDSKRQAELKMEVESKLLGLVQRVNHVASEEVEKIKPEKTEYLNCTTHPEYRGKTKRTKCSVGEHVGLERKSLTLAMKYIVGISLENVINDVICLKRRFGFIARTATEKLLLSQFPAFIASSDTDLSEK